MPLRVWNGSAYVAANLPKVNAGNVPTAAYIWNGSAYVQVWPEEWLNENWDSYAHESAGWGINFGMWSGSTGQIGAGRPTARSVSGTVSKFSESAMCYATATQDDQFIEWDHTESTYHSVATNNEYGVGIRCNQNPSGAHTGVWVYLTTGQVGLYRTLNGTQTAVNALFNYTVPYNTRLRWSAVGNVYTLIRLDTMAVITTWNDSTGLSPRGSAQRKLVLALSSNRPFAQVQYQSPTVDNMVWRAA